VPREGVCGGGGEFLLCLTTAIADSASMGVCGARAVFASLSALFHYYCLKGEINDVVF